MLKLFFTTLLLISTFAITIHAQGYKIGDEAEDFSLMNTDGNMVSLKDFPEAKGFIVIFTCNHCPYSVAYEDRIIELDKKFKPLGYPVIAVNPNDPAVSPEDSYDKMKIRAGEKKFRFPYLFDEGQHVVKKYGATRTPHVFILNKADESFTVKYIGAIDDNYGDVSHVNSKFVEMAINNLLKGHNPVPDLTKAIGCTIKYKK